MRILLIGAPKVGKSTVIANFLQKYKGHCRGIVMHRMIDDDGVNQGFEAVTLDDRKAIIAHRTLVQSDHIIGNGHRVDISKVDSFIVGEIQSALDEGSSSLIVVDEIGRMQALSTKFLTTVSDLFESKSNVLATIVSDPEPWSLPYKKNPDNILIMVNKDNRQVLPKVLYSIFSHLKIFERLRAGQQKIVMDMLRKYCDESQFIQIMKLFNNAIEYIMNNKVQKINPSEFVVYGNSSKHCVFKNGDTYTCDCDLYCGRGDFTNMSGQCSHIQSVMLN